jgi:hypothetical protein
MTANEPDDPSYLPIVNLSATVGNHKATAQYVAEHVDEIFDLILSAGRTKLREYRGAGSRRCIGRGMVNHCPAAETHRDRVSLAVALVHVTPKRGANACFCRLPSFDKYVRNDGNVPKCSRFKSALLRVKQLPQGPCAE